MSRLHDAAVKPVPFYDAQGRHVCDYAPGDALLIFGNEVKLKKNKLIGDGPKTESVARHDPEWKMLRYGNGSVGLWTPEDFERRFKVPYNDSFVSVNDVLYPHRAQRPRAPKSPKLTGARAVKKHAGSKYTVVFDDGSGTRRNPGPVGASGASEKAEKGGLKDPKRNVNVSNESLLEGFDRATMRQTLRKLDRLGTRKFVAFAMEHDPGLHGSDLDRLVRRYRNRVETRKNVLHAVARAIQDAARRRSDERGAPSAVRAWAEKNASSSDGALAHACADVLDCREHTLVFDDDCAIVALEHNALPTYMPYDTTIVQAAINGEVRIAGARQADDGSVRAWTIVGDKFANKALRMLAFVEQRCSIVVDEGGAARYRRTASNEDVADTSAKGVGSTIHAARAKQPREVEGDSLENEADGPRRAVAPHMRRAHARRQHYGKGNARVKTIIVRETYVHGHDVGGGSSTALPIEERTHRVSLS